MISTSTATIDGSTNYDTYTPERHLPTPGQRGHSLQQHTAAGTAAPTTTDTGKYL